MKFGLVFTGAAIAAIVFSGASQAATIVTDYATWVADVNAQYAETATTGLPLYTTPVPGFSLPYGTTVSLTNGSGDIVLQPLNGWGPWSGSYGGDIVGTLGQTETLTFGGTPVYAFGMDVEPDTGLFPAADTFTITLSDGTTTTVSNIYGTDVLGTGDTTTQFIGFVGAGITSITVSTAVASDFAFGNFVSAPEPMSMAVLATGLAGLGTLRRKARRTAA